jgi:predicted RNase H-like HicB family nuclease
MKYKVALHHSEEGYNVFVPGMPGCCSQGETEQEALTNIGDAIREYMEVVMEQLDDVEIREVEVDV